MIIGKIKRKVKRHIDVYLFPNKVEKQLHKRHGKCLQCGRCCKLVFKCPMLEEKNGIIRCKIYNHRSRVCRLFPINEEDLKDVNYQCNYSFRDYKN
ncbi:MAG: hypothetical protein AUJ85_03505 [Elusimicrobia bacterium CG1_02_37_114]|nr:MAG: hypothetical protein AUJ85_03505 [Elusimicrobia bacterium CG1_02_37_114]PIV52229.1 MAG: hypothetical protein COS17_10260 [Elusimicrobia bacterium CG02_land_8_20_14_3_00_37_13]PIZ14074.1 MAG: hypothetical protein COY53_01590 [Elusimicrobia bacterium CG_4_10_14_0_8_um_filter_37_32]